MNKYDTLQAKADALRADFIAAHDRLTQLSNEALALYEAEGDAPAELMRAIEVQNALVAAAHKAWERAVSRFRAQLDAQHAQEMVEAAERLAVRAPLN